MQIVRAEDPEGKFGQTSVRLTVTDINDQNPVFVDEPYSFRVLEGVAGAPVGRVKATDADAGDNAIIYYSVGAFRLSHFASKRILIFCLQ